MNYPIFFGAVTLGAAAVLAGCSARTDCTNALETAERAVAAQQPPGEWMPRIDAACGEAAMDKWTTDLARDCAPVFGFHVGLSGNEKPAECSGAGFDSAWNLGEMIAGMRAEEEEIKRRLDDASLPAETRRDLQQRLVVIGRDLPQVEALARMDGFLPPAEIPEANQ